MRWQGGGTARWREGPPGGEVVGRKDEGGCEVTGCLRGEGREGGGAERDGTVVKWRKGVGTEGRWGRNNEAEGWRDDKEAGWCSGILSGWSGGKVGVGEVVARD